MKSRLIAIVGAIVAALTVAIIVDAQPVNPPGIRYVVTSSRFTGDGTKTATKLELNIAGASCSAGSAIGSINGLGSGTCVAVGSLTGITAGSGLTGGGTSGAVTVDVGAGSNITVASDTVSVATSPDFSAGTLTTGAVVGTIITPTVAADTNNWNPAGLSTATVIAVTGTGPNRTITGLTAQAEGRRISIRNVSALLSVTLPSGDPGSLAANQFDLSALGDLGAGLSVGAGEAIDLLYINSRWTACGRNDFSYLRVRNSAAFAGAVDISGLLQTPGGITADGTVQLNATSGSTAVHNFKTTAITTTALSGSTDDYAPTGLATATEIDNSPSAAATLTGLTGGADGREITIHNTSTDVTKTLTLANETTSTTTNRFTLPTGVNWTIQAGSSIKLHYTGGSVNRWIAVAAAFVPAAGITGSGTANTTTKWTGSSSIGNAWALDDGTSWGVSGKFLITEASGNTTISGTGDVVGNFNVNTNKFSVVASSGDTTAAGTLGVTGLATLSGGTTATGTINLGTATTGTTTSKGPHTFDQTTTHTGTATFNGTLSTTSTTNLGDDSSDAITLSNGLIGGAQPYSGQHYEQSDEWFAPVQISSGGQINNWACTASGGSAACNYNLSTASTSRPGILDAYNGDSATGTEWMTASRIGVDFGSASWVFEWVGGFKDLSSSSQGYAWLGGFLQTPQTATQPEGCFFAYDERNALPGGVNSGNAQALECWCVTNTTSRTGYLINASGNSDESFALGTGTVAAASTPNTNMYHLKIVTTGTTRAEFYRNGTKVCDINTNMGSGSSHMTGIGFGSVRSVGTTGTRIWTDYTRYGFDLNSARSP